MRLLAAAMVLALFFSPAAQAREATTSYFGVYLKGTKLGSLTLTRDDSASRDGRAAVRTGSILTLTLSVLGKTSELRSETISWADLSSGSPLAIEQVSTVAGRATRVWATFDETAVRYRADIQGTLREGQFVLGPGETFLTEVSAALPTRPEAGKRRRGKVFLPDALQLIDSEQAIEGPEPLTVGKTAHLAFRLTEKSPLSPGTYFLSERGELLSARIALGMELRREERAAALAVPPGPAPELTRLIGVVPVGEPLLAARRLREVRYVLEGVTRPLPTSDGVQQVRREKDQVHVSVTTGPLPPAGARLFSRPEDAPEPLRRFLSPTAYVSSDAPEVKALAYAILGEERDSARAAARLSRYVHEAIQPDASIPALRTARDIYRDRRGVCRDYTTFFTALARAVGLPTRQCVGLAYVDGIFVYHAWPEVYVGSGRWVALEPTWGESFADATHLKLAEGELTDVFRVAADIGSYRLRVVSAR